MPSIQSGNRISPAMIVIIVILAIVVFISGLLHLLVRFIMKQRSSSNFESGGNLDMMSGSGVFQRQLQHLFNLHDSGLDQAFIDALPVFLYKDLVGGCGGLNEEEPYDCPVCLSELSEQDKLRLLPLCGHAFHIDCIDTWLLSNSTCPVCRGTLLVEGFSIDNPCFDFDDNNNSRNEEDGGGVLRNVGIDVVVVPKPSAETEKRVFSVRLGKFKNVNEEEEEGRVTADIELGETSNNNLDGRRCFSLGSYRYVLADTELQVAICPPDITTYKINTIDEENPPPPTPNGGKKINMGSKGESFSVSKVWQWSSKKGKLGNHHNHVSDFSYPFSSGSIQSFTTT